MKPTIHLLAILVVIFSITACSPEKKSELKAGYDKAELLQLLPAMERTYDSADIGGFKTPEPVNIRQVYRSKVSPLMNRFDVWLTGDRKAAITVRGTIVDPEALSFTTAFYCGMIPATGKIQMSDTAWFDYKLADLKGAGVHAGFVLGLWFMHRELLGQVNQHYKDGIRDFIIVGHSQGSGDAFVVTSWLRYLQKDGKIPADIRFKTYCIAAPKPGNLQYAYDYERLTAGGYSFSVNNVIDWVPCIALTLQSATDFPTVNPFADIKGFLTSINYTPGPNFDQGYGQFTGAIPAAVKQVATIIHENVYPKILKALPGFVEPEFLASFDYERAGVQVPLVPDAEYYKHFPNDPANFKVWENHSVFPYFILVKGN